MFFGDGLFGKTTKNDFMFNFGRFSLRGMKLNKIGDAKEVKNKILLVIKSSEIL